MSRHLLHLDAQRTLIFGTDPPMNTLYAQLFDLAVADDGDTPAMAAGYSPEEREIATPPPDGYGPYPLDADGLDALLAEWGLSADQRDLVARALVVDAAR